MLHYGNHGKLYYGGPIASLHEYRSKNSQALWSSSLTVQHDLQSYRILLTGWFEVVPKQSTIEWLARYDLGGKQNA
jgi:hypothetical protein